MYYATSIVGFVDANICTFVAAPGGIVMMHQKVGNMQKEGHYFEGLNICKRYTTHVCCIALVMSYLQQLRMLSLKLCTEGALF